MMDTDQITAVSVVGVGEIGNPVTNHLLDGGYDVTVCDTDQNVLSQFEDTPISVADSPGEAAAETDLSLIAVGTYPQIKSIVYDGGLFEHADPGHVVGIVSTISPVETIELADLAAEHDLAVLDVPVCRGNQAAVDGELLVLGGGDERVFERVRPVFECYALPGDVVYLGSIGSGQVGKASNNVLLWSNLVANYEVLSLADSWDVDLEVLRDALTRSSGDNWPLREWDWQYIGWAEKDMDIALEMADQKDVTIPYAGLLSQLIRDLDEDNLDEVR